MKQGELRETFPDIEQFAHDTCLYVRERNSNEHLGHVGDIEEDINEGMTSSDLRSIIKYEEELSQCHNFSSILPTRSDGYAFRKC